ncbi:MAG: hypothetical protein M3R51_07985 [Candidatus Eremiobacteraeota bacterium]|nr:hypothetical protein [Candidatus Eremiobacteraeota bacterium]
MWLLLVAALMVIITLIMKEQRRTVVHATAPSRGSDGVMYLRGTMEMRGTREEVAQALDTLAQAMQEQVNARTDRRRATASAVPVPTRAEFRHKIVPVMSRVGSEVDAASAAFSRASAPHGSPQTYVDTYATLLDHLLRARDDVQLLGTPPGFTQGRVFCEQMISLYDQIAAWPAQLRQTARTQDGHAAITTAASVPTAPLFAALDHDAGLEMAAMRAGKN